ncbi:MobQ family relaxase [Nostoc parmelioides]|uniref:MobA/MobL family protein n=1 Tax=Nostoc parmelioides FACHB-3921 TaxID=2692909 RepID=A0ABR8BS52_9NOSO|nr:MobQ family relaxase [Nostoc parmelioides]MBD2255730.1 MobA/MobL family protein [Nostoc parmelioides FACHB-3921]
MAIYFFRVRIIHRQRGPTVLFAAAYRTGTRLTHFYEKGKVADYRYRKKAFHSEILAPPGVPVWVYDRSRLWSEVERKEERKDAQLARELQIAVPVELTDAQQIKLVRDFVQEQCVAYGMVADIAIRRPSKSSDSRNIHAHVLLTTRNIDGDGFQLKNRDWNSLTRLNEWRRQWAIYTNRALEAAGVSTRIDHRTLEEQKAAPESAPHTGKTINKHSARPTPQRKRKASSQPTDFNYVNRRIEYLERQLALLRDQVKFMRQQENHPQQREDNLDELSDSFLIEDE